VVSSCGRTVVVSACSQSIGIALCANGVSTCTSTVSSMPRLVSVYCTRAAPYNTGDHVWEGCPVNGKYSSVIPAGNTGFGAAATAADG
jgi:hypothetical protein